VLEMGFDMQNLTLMGVELIAAIAGLLGMLWAAKPRPEPVPVRVSPDRRK
jgi:hypothetical protein